MKDKWPLYLGIFLLTLGIILRISIDFDPWSLVILLSGVGFKVAYILTKIIKKTYKPGFEIALLLIGLTLFMGSIILNKQGVIDNPILFKIIGLSLKLAFVVIFIIKSRKSHPSISNN